MKYFKRKVRGVYRCFYDRPEHCYCHKLDKSTSLSTICMYCGILVGKIAKKEGIQEVDVRKPTTRKKTGKEIWCEA